ncbi:hypothetical protein J1605_009739 [Eschrichtius robustus]|uniref:Uncharacterized protein n=1 Tax=Eschrichtius robustus TaxID=9764 RepID=A0AB34GRQ9_ESCRO|nr:hypothetical protein J1605_009739 [Eschrichtius robustus]
MPFLPILQSTANPKQQSFSELAIPTFNSYSESSQSSSTENQWPEGDQELGRKSSSTAKVPANPLPGWRRPPQHSPRPGPVVSPCTNIPPAAVVEYTPDATNLPRGYPAKENSLHTGQPRQVPGHQSLPESAAARGQWESEGPSPASAPVFQVSQKEPA